MTPLAVALAELAAGVREDSGRNDGTPAARYNGGERKPWCAAFVAWCYAQAGLRLPGRHAMLASVAYLEGQLLEAGCRVARPRPGDVVCYSARGQSDRGPGRHCGIVESVSAMGYHSVEGNLGNAVARAWHRYTDPTITGFYRWPKGQWVAAEGWRDESS